jgi:hypothetical protein
MRRQDKYLAQLLGRSKKIHNRCASSWRGTRLFSTQAKPGFLVSVEMFEEMNSDVGEAKSRTSEGHWVDLSPLMGRDLIQDPIARRAVLLFGNVEI